MSKVRENESVRCVDWTLSPSYFDEFFIFRVPLHGQTVAAVEQYGIRNLGSGTLLTLHSICGSRIRIAVLK